jgi:transcriptional regulator with PAS, ATPase and Fis domain
MTAAIPPLPSSQGAALEALNALPWGVVVIDRERRIRAINDAFRRGLQVLDSQWATACDAQTFDCFRSPGSRSGVATIGPRCAACELRTLAVRVLESDRTVTRAANVEVDRGDCREQVTIDVTAVPLRLAGDDLAVLIVDRMQPHALDAEPAIPGEADGIIGNDPALLEMLELVRQVAAMDVPVLIQGESGTGKELVAHALHRLSDRSDRMIVPVNCGALPDGLLESELFGHIRGAFTGAVRDKKGRFELADGGTLFLDAHDVL